MVLKGLLRSVSPVIQQIRHKKTCKMPSKPKHLICFKQWSPKMVMSIVNSALHLKAKIPNTHGVQLKTLKGAKIMILQEVNRPLLQMAVSKAATLLGAHDVIIVDHVVWEQDYMGRVFSRMSDAIFVSTSTHMCILRFSKHSSVPVLCMHSRAHSSIRALAGIMTLIDKYGDLKGLNIGYLGIPHQVLNSFLLLAPMFGANIKFKCCCDKAPVSPLLFNASQEMAKDTEVKACKTKEEVLEDTHVIMAGPTAPKEKVKHFTLNVEEITKVACKKWYFIHTCPRGEEVPDELFYHKRSLTFTLFDNMQYIAAALMANAVKGIQFKKPK